MRNNTGIDRRAIKQYAFVYLPRPGVHSDLLFCLFILPSRAHPALRTTTSLAKRTAARNPTSPTRNASVLKDSRRKKERGIKIPGNDRRFKCMQQPSYVSNSLTQHDLRTGKKSKRTDLPRPLGTVPRLFGKRKIKINAQKFVHNWRLISAALRSPLRYFQGFRVPPKPPKAAKNWKSKPFNSRE